TRFVSHSRLFFCQAEYGIRDDLVTGVQTCALPISSGDTKQIGLAYAKAIAGARAADRLGVGEPDLLGVSARVLRHGEEAGHAPRSEERRVGKEGSAAWGWTSSEEVVNNLMIDVETV